MDYKDYYKILGVAKTAAADDLKKAYRKLARKYHPDVNPGDKEAERRCKEVTEAYEVVGDPEKRRKYDELGANWKSFERAQAAGQNPFAGGGPFGGPRWNTQGSGSGFRTMSEDDARRMFGGDPFSDFFQTFFGGRGGASTGNRSSRRRRGRDIEHELTLTLEQAYAGVTQRLTLTNGGHVRSVDVRIPAGVDEGSRVRIAGKGEKGSADGAAGDLFLRVKQMDHAVYQRKGRDLYMKAEVPLTTAVLGGEVALQTIAGKAVWLKIPATTQQGQVFRIKGAGMPSLRKGGVQGHLYATVNVRLPSRVGVEARKHYEALADLEEASDTP